MKRRKYIWIIVITVLLVIISVRYYKSIPFINEFIYEWKINKINNMLKNNPYSIALHYKLAQLYLEHGKLDAYEEKIILLSKLSPDSYIYPEKLGNHYFSMQKNDRALQFYKDALKLYNGEVKNNLLHFKIANCYINLNNNEKAIEEYKMQIEILKQINNSEKTAKFIDSINKVIKSLEVSK
jgi:predicted Zn-dependent protease